MHRLAQLEHDVVCDVNNVVDWTDASTTQTAAQPVGRGFDADILHHPADIAIAQVRGRDIDTGQILGLARTFRLDNGPDLSERQVKRHGCFASQTFDGKAVDTLEVISNSITCHECSEHPECPAPMVSYPAG